MFIEDILGIGETDHIQLYKLGKYISDDNFLNV